MQPDEFMSAQYGAVAKPGDLYEDQKIEGIVSNTAAGITITALTNQNDVDVLADYIGSELLLAPNFIRVNNTTDKYFKSVEFTGSAIFIQNKP